MVPEPGAGSAVRFSRLHSKPISGATKEKNKPAKDSVASGRASS